MPLEFTYSDVESVLMALNRIADEKRTAFRARLKHLQRLGFPEGANTGTGRRAAYSVSMLLQMCLATQLAQTGMAPKRIVQTIRGNWHDTEASIYFALLPANLAKTFKPPIEDNQLVWVISPEALRDLTAEGEGEYDYHDSAAVYPISELADALCVGLDAVGDEVEGPNIGEMYRHVAIQLRPFTHLVVWYLTQVRADVSPTDVLHDLQEVLVTRAETIKSFIRTFESGGRNGDNQKT